MAAFRAMIIDALEEMGVQPSQRRIMVMMKLLQDVLRYVGHRMAEERALAEKALVEKALTKKGQKQ